MARTGAVAGASMRVPGAIVGLIALGAIALVFFAISRPEPPSYVPTATGEIGTPDATGAHVVTIDASSQDHWRFFSFEHGVLPGRATDLEWDLAFRRFHIVANGGASFAGRGAIADLGSAPFDAPLNTAIAFEPTLIAGRDSVNPAIERWYRYGFTSHLLMPLERTYLVRAASGDLFVLEILGYYCPGATPGCLTFRWRRAPPTH